MCSFSNRFTSGAAFAIVQTRIFGHAPGPPDGASQVLYHCGISAPIERIRTDFIVVGAGVAGLRAAIELAPAGRVLIIAKDSLRESSSEYAQGGIAAAVGDD